MSSGPDSTAAYQTLQMSVRDAGCLKGTARLSGTHPLTPGPAVNTEKGVLDARQCLYLLAVKPHLNTVTAHLLPQTKFKPSGHRRAAQTRVVGDTSPLPKALSSCLEGRARLRHSKCAVPPIRALGRPG